jgi:uncharacterized integral membrane protein
MAKMAVYDKKGFEKDANANQYFRHDFIYKKNMQMRFYLGLGCLILVLFYILHLLGVQEADFFTLNYQAEIVRIVVVVVIIMVAYSFIGTIIFTREYLISQKRVDAYFNLMKELTGEKPEIPVEAYLPGVDNKQKPLAKRSKKNKKAAEAEDDFEPFEPYRKGDTRSMPVYNYRSSDDPEFWEDEDKDKEKGQHP